MSLSSRDGTIYSSKKSIHSLEDVYSPHSVKLRGNHRCGIYKGKWLSQRLCDSRLIYWNCYHFTENSCREKETLYLEANVGFGVADTGRASSTRSGHAFQSAASRRRCGPAWSLSSWQWKSCSGSRTPRPCPRSLRFYHTTRSFGRIYCPGVLQTGKLPINDLFLVVVPWKRLSH